jgi:hypothetical protein
MTLGANTGPSDPDEIIQATAVSWTPWLLPHSAADLGLLRPSTALVIGRDACSQARGADTCVGGRCLLQLVRVCFDGLDACRN